YGAEQADRVALVLLDQVGRQVRQVRVVGGEVALDRRRAGQGGEALRAAGRPEQGAREGAVRVRQCDDHGGAAGPDVQRVRVERELAAAGWDGQLLVAVVEELQPLGEQVVGEQLAAHGRARTVGAEHHVRGRR